MSMFDEAAALRTTMKMRGYSQAEMAKKLGVSPSYVANKLRLLSLDEDSKSAIIESHLTERHARALLCIKKKEQRLIALKEIMQGQLTVAETEELINSLLEDKSFKDGNRGEKMRATDSAVDSIRNLISRLNDSGIYATQRTEYKNDKIWLTICIQEPK